MMTLMVPFYGKPLWDYSEHSWDFLTDCDGDDDDDDDDDDDNNYGDDDDDEDVLQWRTTLGVSHRYAQTVLGSSQLFLNY